MNAYTHNVIAAVVNMLLLMGGIVNSGQQPASQSPSVVKAVAPFYPAMAATLRISGTVVVEVEIDLHGSATSVRIVDGPELLHKSAENAARRWLFVSADDQASIRTARLSFTFKLMPRDVSPDELLPIFLPPYSVEVRGREPDIITMVISDPPLSKRPSRLRKKKH